MTINTIKFSQFQAADPDDVDNTLVGISSPTGGTNIKSPFTVTWTTLTRPVSPYDGLMGYNTTLESWEYFQNSTDMWVQFANNTSGENWTVVTTASVSAATNKGYVTNRSATPVQVLLPAAFDVGDRILVMGMGAGGWSLVANTGQSIQFGSVATSADGSINSDIQYANIEVKGMVANTTWTVWSINSNPTYL